MSKVIGIDIGTSACKAVAIDENANIIATCSREYPLYTPEPGWTEQDPSDWLRASQECLAELGPADCVGFTGQMHGAVFLDNAGQVIRPAILWNDQRTVAEAEEISALVGIQKTYEITCNPSLTGFQAAKILWLRNNEASRSAKLSQVLLPKDYVRSALLNLPPATDVSDASGTGLFDVPNRRWSQELIEILQLDGLLPPSVESSHLPGGGDQAAGAVGMGAVERNSLGISLGTSGVVFSPQDTPAYDAKGRAHTFCHANGKWHSMSVMLSCGAALKWARDNFGYNSYEEMFSLLAQAKSSSAKFRPYFAGERSPHNNPNLRASLESLSLGDGKPEIARAVVEGITFGLLDGYDILRTLRKHEPEAIRVTGGGAKSDVWMQLLADAFGVPTQRLRATEGPALGAAILAGVSIDLWPDVESGCSQVVRIDREFEPNLGLGAELRSRRAEWLSSWHERNPEEPPII